MSKKCLFRIELDEGTFCDYARDFRGNCNGELLYLFQDKEGYSHGFCPTLNKNILWRSSSEHRVEIEEINVVPPVTDEYVKGIGLSSVSGKIEPYL